MTDDGNLFEHIVLGVLKLEKYRTTENSLTLDLLQHVITSHHGKMEYGSPMTPKFLEAHIISAADGIDAKAQTILELNAKSKPEDKYTGKEWTLDNRPQFTQSYIASILA
jgi:3'-5' exoribonuclease